MEQAETPKRAPWKVLLETLKDNVIRSKLEVESAGEKEKSQRKKELQVINNRFTRETTLYIDKLSPIEVVDYTKLQIDAELLASASSTASDIPKINTKLPQLELSKFNGDILRWPEFWDRFRSTIDSQQLSDTDKLSYLQASLGREALAAIEGLDTTNQNYAVAVDILKDRYGKVGVVLDAHYQALQNIRRATNIPQECMSVYNEIERHLRVLKSMGENVNHNNLRTIILGKFPSELIYELRNKVKLEEQNVDSIRKLLEHQITAHIATKTPPSCTTEIFIQHAGKQRYTSRQSNQRTLKRRATSMTAMGPTANKRGKMRPCVFCMGEHYNSLCPKPVKERKGLLKGKCFRCFSKAHQAKDCKFKKPCYHCRGDHNSALCMVNKKDNNQNTKNSQNTTPAYLGTGANALLQTAIIQIKHGISSRNCRAILDTGSSRSYVTCKLVETLSLPTKEDTFLTIYTFGSIKPQEVKSPLTEIEVIFQSSSVTMKVNIMPYITEKVDTAPRSLINRLAKGLKTQLADDGSLGTDIDILIGNDYYHSFISNERIQIDDHLFLIRSHFGLVWSGHQNEENKEEIMSIITHVQGTPTQLSESKLDLPLRNNEVHKLWDLEAIGITDCLKTSRDDEAVEQFNKTVKFENNRYWIKWPWCRPASELNDNFGLAFGRLKGLWNRMDKNILQKYIDILKEQLTDGVIEPVQNIKVDHPIHYMPHHYVMKADKMRLVYDASSKVKGQYSLNECLYRGPLLLESLVGIIIRMRTHKFGISADVEKAFLQIGLQERDRDVTRFLWLKDTNYGLTENNLVHYRFCRVPFGIGCSPFILAITLKHHLHQINTPVCRTIARDIYVDNLITGADDDKGCLRLYNETNSVFKAITMNMRQWHTNNTKLKTFIQKDKLGNETSEVSLLGINWDIDNDVLSLKTEVQTIAASMTKRKLLALIASVYDPCGYGTPLLVGAKVLLQTLWKKGLKWDDILPSELQEELQVVLTQMKYISEIKLPRWYGIEGASDSNKTRTELHCFTDASEKAYAAVIYIKVIQEYKAKVTLVMSKSRLSPVKNGHLNTIPRAELLGVLIGCRLMNYVKTQLHININKKYIWTDSQIVLHWLNSNRVLPPFVANRIKEIKKNKEVEFRYISSTENVADLATRPCNLQLTDTNWFKGPQFIINEEKNWPNPSFPVLNLLGGEGLRNDSEETVVSGEEIPQETSSTEIIIELQKTYFPKEYEGKETDLSRGLRIFKDEQGLLRCEGRLKNADLAIGQKFPILLPRESEYTQEVIENIHKSNYHVGVSHTLALVRKKFWIVKGRALTQRVLRKCIQCRKYGGGPYKLPPMPSLPPERVCYYPAFTYTGLDYLGPLMNNSGEKRWICLFTCLSVRAIHLETVNNLSTEECNMALRRFTATRGLPQVITSDNATQFKLMAEVLSGKHCIENNIQWRFIPELAPWFGGFYERLVALVKHCIKRTVEKHLLNDQQLITITKEVEAVLNTRPLTYVGNEVENILTPADFLRVGGVLVPTATEEDSMLPVTEIKQRLIDGWKRGQIILEECIQMFKNQYLPLLRKRSNKIKEARNKVDIVPKVGDIVQIKDEGNRTGWKVGTISSTVTSSDGKIRVAKVKVGEKEFTRSISHLYPLELDEEENENGNRKENENDNRKENKNGNRKENGNEIEKEEDLGKELHGANTKATSRGYRKAASEARKKLNEWTKLLLVRSEICANINNI